LRSSIGQERLNSMLISTAHLDILNDIGVCSVTR
jgi:hypothetical protein